MALLAGASLAATASGLFFYNRENFKFDQKQVLERELLRVEMQIKRFELYREDVRDLVELTVDRMDVYYLVAALFLDFTVILFCQGRIQASSPPFLLSLFLLSNACAFVYLILGVWLSMHASISSHSFGVRMLTRFVRLPIPGSRQIDALGSRMAEFEFQDLNNLLRVPFVQSVKQAWRHSSPDLSAAAGSSSPPSKERQPRRSASHSVSAHHAEAAASADDSTHTEAKKLLDRISEASVLQPSVTQGRHVQLFRAIQAKWQCYDAYARVCMSFGVNRILQGLTYYCVCYTFIENDSPTAGIATFFAFQSVALALLFVDISKLTTRDLVAVQGLATMPALFALVALATTQRKDDNRLEPRQYRVSPVILILEAVWLEALLKLAAPSKDARCLPWRFRAVLFMDVFGSFEDPIEQETAPSRSETKEQGPIEAEMPMGSSLSRQQYVEDLLTAERTIGAEEALRTAMAALGRWAAVPTANLAAEQASEIMALRSEILLWQRALQGELAWRAERRGQPQSMQILDEAWHEGDDDPFAGAFIGPLYQQNGEDVLEYHYDLEARTCVWALPPDSAVLQLELVAAAVRGLEAGVRLLMESRPDVENAAARAQLAAGSSPGDGHPLPGQIGILNELSKAPISMIVDFATDVCECVRSCWHWLSTCSKRRYCMSLGQPLLSDEPRLSRGAAVPGAHGTALPARTVEALTGPHSKHFAPSRLPWKVFKSMTRMLQASFGFTIMMTLWREIQREPHLDVHFYAGESSHSTDHRRLAAIVGNAWTFAVRNMTTPLGDLFRPRLLSCLPDRNLIATSQFASYATTVSSKGDTGGSSSSQGFAHVDIPPGSAAFCPTASKPPSTPGAGLVSHEWTHADCYFGSPDWSSSQAGHGVRLWRHSDANGQWQEEAVLLVGDLQWKLVAGAVMTSCGAVEVPPRISSMRDSRCLLLAGWDGESLPVSLVPLADINRGDTSGREIRISRQLELPILVASESRGPGDASSSRRNVASIHVEPYQRQLLILVVGARFGETEIQVWDLISLSLRSRLHPVLDTFPQASSVVTWFVPVAACSWSDGDAMLVGHWVSATSGDSPSQGLAPAAVLAWAADPFQDRNGSSTSGPLQEQLAQNEVLLLLGAFVV